MARAQRQGQGHAPRHRGTASPLPLSTPSHRTCTTLVLYYPCSLRLATAARVVLELHNTAAAPATIYFYWTPPTTSPCVPARYSYYAIPAPAPITTTVTTTMPIPRPRRTGWPTLWWPRGSASPIGCSTSSSAARTSLDAAWKRRLSFGRSRDAKQGRGVCSRSFRSRA